MELNPAQEKLAARIAASLLRFQRRVADKLNAYTFSWSALRWKIWLFCFCVVFGLYCAYLIWEAV
ncbi:hypothetical protein [Pedobacter aquatilis]|uniref:hypothetical protein n=1 Tax=Pedobacter aquatilis TaxID=351343 RepID=UPI00292DA545|nr:hypothetical protein [Pedobacter aquatilis]